MHVKVICVIIFYALSSGAHSESGKLILTIISVQEILHWLHVIILEFTAILPNGEDHVCPGQTIIYECTVCGGVVTVWKGSVFDCVHNANMIALLHFNLEFNTGECNDGDIVAFGIRSVDGCYTSQLNITMRDGTQMKSVECTMDDGISTVLLFVGITNLPRIGKQNGSSVKSVFKYYFNFRTTSYS